MKKRFFIGIILILLMIILSGCWSRKELNEIAIVTGLAIDKFDDEYKVTAQVLNPGEIAGQQAQSTRVAVSTYEATGRSVFEAIRELTKVSPRKVYLAHLRIIILGEDLAKQGIEKSLDFLSRDHEVRTDFFILISKEKDATSILKVLTPIDKIPTTKIFSSIQSSEEAWAPTRGVHLDNLISQLASKGDNPVLTGVYITGDVDFGGSLKNVERIASPTSLRLDHLGAFRGDKLVGWLNKNESKGYNYITDNVHNTVGVEKCKGGNISLEVYETQTEVEVKEQNGLPKIKVKVTSDVSIGEVRCNEKMLEEKRLKELEEQLDKQTQKVLKESIDKAKGLKTDIFGFGSKIHKFEPKLWEKVKENWNEQGFVDLEVEVTSKYHIRRTGTIMESLQNSGD